jgi:predicted nucleic-acid-binding protein
VRRIVKKVYRREASFEVVNTVLAQRTFNVLTNNAQDILFRKMSF